MPKQPPRALGRLAALVPGYAGYGKHADRRATDLALREAIAGRLGVIRARLEREAHAAADRGESDQVGAWQAAMGHLDRVDERLRAPGPGAEASEALGEAGDLDAGRVAPLHDFDLLLFDRIEELVLGFQAPELRRDLLPGVESDLDDVDQKLARRAAMFEDLRRPDPA